MNMIKNDVFLAIAKECPHCIKMLEIFTSLVKKGVVDRLEIVNISSNPEISKNLEIETVPWIKIGNFI